MFESDVAMQLKQINAKLAQLMQQKINAYDLRIGLVHLAILVRDHPEMNQKEFAKSMRFTEGAMSHAVKRLIEKGILEQVPLESDMRYNRLSVTEKGEQFINDYEDYLRKVYKDIFNGFDTDELVVLDAYLKRINANLDELDGAVIEAQQVEEG